MYMRRGLKATKGRAVHAARPPSYQGAYGMYMRRGLKATRGRTVHAARPPSYQGAYDMYMRRGLKASYQGAYGTCGEATA